jgi:hypothetical protein
LRSSEEINADIERIQFEIDCKEDDLIDLRFELAELQYELERSEVN